MTHATRPPLAAVHQTPSATAAPAGPPADAALAASELRYRRLFETAKDGILILDAQTGMVVDVNPFLVALLGFSHADFLGKKVWELGFFKDIAANEEKFMELQAREYVRYDDLPLETATGRRIEVEFVSNVYRVEQKKVIQCNVRDITARKRTERLARDVLAVLNRPNNTLNLIHDIMAMIKNLTGIEAIGIRLKADENFPYYQTRGFPDDFVRRENQLCTRDDAGQIRHDDHGHPVLECMCGSVIRGQTDGPYPFFTPGGSFWTNNTTELPAAPATAEHQAGMCRRCQDAGYASVALIPLRAGTEIIGLLQLNDHRRGQFTPDLIGVLEWLGASVGIALTRMRGENAVRASQQIIEGILNAIPARVFWKDKNLFFLGCNTAFARDAGFADPKEIIGKDDFQMGWHEQAELYRDVDREIIASGNAKLLIEEPQTTPDGKMATLLSSKLPLRDATGEICGVLGTYLDITEHKQVEASQARLAMAVEQAAEMIVITDAQATIQYVNPAFEQVSGYRREDVIGKTTQLLKSGKQDSEFYRRMWAVLAGGEVWHGHLINQRKDGTFYEEDASISPVRDAAGKVVNYVAVKRDVTHEVQLESQLRQAQKMEAVGRLAGGVAHDFNNLLTGIMGCAELCRDAIAPDHPAREWLDEITREGERSAEITRQLLAFARKQVIAPRILDLNDAVAGMLKMLRQLIGEDINLAWLPGANLRPVRLDPSQIDQILVNLCINARDAIAGVGKITLETGNLTLDADGCARRADATPGTYVFLAVSDTGAGMSPETLAQVFEPFFTTKSIGKGTGMGLATVYGIVKQNHGFIYAYSEPGQGATFKIYLPQVTDEVVVPPVIREVDTLKGRGETVLLVEDQKSLCGICRRFLESFGYRVLATETPEDALNLVDRHPGDIQLLLTDVVMPGMNGRELANRIRAAKPGIRVLFMSGYTADVVTERGVLDRNTAFIAKPFTRNDLARKIREVLETA